MEFLVAFSHSVPNVILCKRYARSCVVNSDIAFVGLCVVLRVKFDSLHVERLVKSVNVLKENRPTYNQLAYRSCVVFCRCKRCQGTAVAVMMLDMAEIQCYTALFADLLNL